MRIKAGCRNHRPVSWLIIGRQRFVLVRQVFVQFAVSGFGISSYFTAAFPPCTSSNYIPLTVGAVKLVAKYVSSFTRKPCAERGEPP